MLSFSSAPLPQNRATRIGILGSGFIINDCHLVSYRHAGFNPVAIASRDPANAARVAAEHNIPQTYSTYEALLDDASIEVLDIAVPPQHQLALIRAACARGTVKGILAQKPLALNYPDAVAAVECCEAAGIVLSINQNMRYDQSVRAAHHLLNTGTLGEPVFATLDMRGVPHWQSWQAETGSASLRIMSIHHLDCMRFWFGNPARIFCSTRPDPRTKFPHSDGICTSILEYENGFRAVIIDDVWTGPAKEGCPADLRIEWRIEGLEGLAIGDIGWCQDPYTTPSKLRYARRGDAEFHHPAWSESWFPDAFAGTMGQLLIALETQTPPAITARDNLHTLALVEAAVLSAREHRAIDPSEISSSSPEQDSSTIPRNGDPNSVSPHHSTESRKG
jgi:predicted dehydrogenase